MLHIILTTIISYNTYIHTVNKQYHDTFTYSDRTGYRALYANNLIAYNWRDMSNVGKRIYNGVAPTKYVLSANY